MSITKMKMSGSTDGRAVKITQTATAGDIMHTAHATSLDELWLWLVNSSASPVKATIEFGGVTSPDDLIEKTIAAEVGPVLIIPGLLVTGSVIVRAFAASANVVMGVGYVNRHTA